jgi:Pilus assembly protein, PilO.
MKFFTDMKDGFEDIKNMLLEQNYRPFWRPVTVVLLVGIAVSILNNHSQSKIADMRRKVDAQQAEMENEVEYKNSKALYEKLVQQLPPVEKKNEWLLSEMVNIFDKVGVEATRTGKHDLEDSDIFTLSSVTVEAELDYNQLGKMVEAIESNPYFMRISDLTVTRAEGSLGKVQMNMRVHTVFVNATPQDDSDNDSN